MKNYVTSFQGGHFSCYLNTSHLSHDAIPRLQMSFSSGKWVISSLCYLGGNAGWPPSAAWVPIARVHHLHSPLGTYRLLPWRKHACNSIVLLFTLRTASRGEQGKRHHPQMKTWTERLNDKPRIAAA